MLQFLIVWESSIQSAVALSRRSLHIRFGAYHCTMFIASIHSVGRRQNSSDARNRITLFSPSKMVVTELAHQPQIPLPLIINGLSPDLPKSVRN